MAKRLAAIFIILVLLTLMLSSCTKEHATSCRSILDALIDQEITLPSGKIYDINAPDGDKEFLPERLLNNLYGNGETPPMRDGWLDISLFLSSSDHPCEFAVFYCDSPNTASDTARLLLGRIDLIRTSKGVGDYAVITENAAVTVTGNYVVLIISSDVKNAQKTVSRMIK